MQAKEKRWRKNEKQERNRRPEENAQPMKIGMNNEGVVVVVEVELVKRKLGGFRASRESDVDGGIVDGVDSSGWVELGLAWGWLVLLRR